MAADIEQGDSDESRKTEGRCAVSGEYELLAAETRRFAVRSGIVAASLPFVEPLPSTQDIAPMNPLDAQQHERWMKLALDQAWRAYDQSEVPVGAVVVHNEQVIGEGCNQRETLQDPTAHAEMIALTQAASVLGSWRLLDCALYVTLEPCPMCAGAIVQSRLPLVVYGTADPKAGACHSLFQITSDPRLNHRSIVFAGVMQAECRSLLQQFFAEQRALGKK